MAINANIDKASRRVKSAYDQNSMSKGLKIPSGIYHGIVVDTVDPNSWGRVKVHIQRFYGALPSNGANASGDEYLGAQWCRVATPFGGTSQPAEGPNGQVSQISYGMTGQPPSNDNEVIVAFSGESHSGVVIGILPDIMRRAGLNGAGPTGKTSAGTTTITQEPSKTATSVDELPDEHPQAERLRTQGLDKDRIRGLNFSTPIRDPISRTAGISTPAGHSFVMDDGRPEDGDQLLVRLRTAQGAQILMDDTNGLTYINNREGNVWIEMNRNGDLDIYSAGSINMHTQGNMNYHVGGSFNLQAAQGINMKSLGAEGVKIETTQGEFNLKAAGNLNLQSDANGNILVSGGLRQTAKRIDLNGPAASAASAPTVTQLNGNTEVTDSVAARVPEAEPWAGHLDISVLDDGSAAGNAGESQSYYYNTPVDLQGYNDQKGQYEQKFDTITDGNYPNLRFASHIDTRIDPALLSIVDKTAREKGVILTVTSGYRSPTYNANVGGARLSQHQLGRAVDVSGSGLTNQDRLDLIAIASRNGIKGIGVYNSGSIHFDNRDGARAGWGPDYTQNTVPSYARTTMNTHRSGGFA